MARRWKPIPDEGGGTSYVAVNPTVGVPHPVDYTPMNSPPRVATTGRVISSQGNQGPSRQDEGESLDSLYEEWVRGDINHTAALVLLGVALLLAGFWPAIRGLIGALLTPTWGKFCALLALVCFGLAAYPWTETAHGRVRQQKDSVLSNLKRAAARMGRLSVMPDQLAAMNEQLDVMIRELSLMRKQPGNSMETVRVKTDWVPSNEEHRDDHGHHGNGDDAGRPPKPSSGLRNKFRGC